MKFCKITAVKSFITFCPGFVYTFKIVASEITTTQRFEGLDRATRGCSLPGPNVIELFTFVIYEILLNATEFVLGKLLQQSIMFASKVSENTIRCSTLG